MSCDNVVAKDTPEPISMAVAYRLKLSFNMQEAVHGAASSDTALEMANVPGEGEGLYASWLGEREWLPVQTVPRKAVGVGYDRNRA
jgi:hypothetical protein